jgi:hypothetical protein
MLNGGRKQLHANVDNDLGIGDLFRILCVYDRLTAGGGCTGRGFSLWNKLVSSERTQRPRHGLRFLALRRRSAGDVLRRLDRQGVVHHSGQFE